MKERTRIVYLDNLKLFLTMIVIVYHCAHGYTGYIDWTYKEGTYSRTLYNFILINKSFFMGLFFLISGYFISISIRRTSAKTFVWKKIKRLILPVFMLLLIEIPVVFYLVNYFVNNKKNSFINYYINVYFGEGKISYGHGWFIVNLFIFSIIYLIYTKIFKSSLSVKIGRLTISKILIILVLLSVSSYIIRIFYPMDVWICLLFIGIEPAHEFQYLILFIVGIVSYRNSWLSNMDKKVCKISVFFSIILIILFCVKVYLPNEIGILINKWYSIYESILCICLCIGLIYLFKKYANYTNKFITLLSRNAYLVYLLHVLFVVIFQVIFHFIDINIYIKFFIGSLLSIVCSFIFAGFVRKIKTNIKEKGRSYIKFMLNI